MAHLLATTRDWNRADASSFDGPENLAVRRLNAFAALSDAEQNLLLQHCANARVYPAQTDLVREGHVMDGMLVVLEGFACWHQYRHTGARQITAYLVPGDFSEWDASLIGRMDHTVSTLSHCRVARIPRDALSEISHAHPGLARAMRMSHLVYEATLREWVVNVGCRSAVERIAHLFCELYTHLGLVGLAQDMSFEMPLTQSDLAVTVGLSNVHVNRSLQSLRRDNLIALKGRRLTILDWVGLSELGDFNPRYLRLGQDAYGLYG